MSEFTLIVYIYTLANAAVSSRDNVIESVRMCCSKSSKEKKKTPTPRRCKF